MTKNISKIMFFMFLSLVLISVGFAQRQTGSIAGQVTDDEGNALPGVTVSVSGPNLQGVVDYISTDLGSFRFPSLPPGTYTVTCVLDQFQTVTRPNIIVNVGKTVTLTMVLEPSAISETVTVTADSPAVDVTSSKIGVTFTNELVNSVPQARSMSAIIMSAPGVVQDTATPSFMAVHGADVSGNIYQLDGLNVEDPLMRQFMTDVDLNMAEEIEMQTGGKPAEIGSASGAYVNIVTKSGGNRLSGTFEPFLYWDSFTGTNATQEQLDAVGLPAAPKTNYRYDISFNLGGPIIKDKLWFFLAGKYLDYESDFIGLDAKRTQTEWFGMGKLTWRLTENLRFMGYFNYRKIDVPINESTTADLSYRTLDSVRSVHYKVPNVNLLLNWVINQNTYLDIRGMWIDRWYDILAQDGAGVRSTDYGTGITSGAHTPSQDLAQWRFLGRVGLTMFVDDFLGGSHEFKFGGEYDRGGFDHASWEDVPLVKPTIFGSPYDLGGNMGSYQAWGVAADRAGTSGALWQTSTLAIYAQDSWTIANRLTINIGLRFDSSQAKLPAQIQPTCDYWLWLDPVFFAEKAYEEQTGLIDWTTISPRFGFVYDLFGTGQTTLKGSFSRYRDYLQLGYFYYLNGNLPYSYRGYVWTDNNMNGEIDPADTNVPTFSVGRGDVPAKDLVDQDMKAPFYNEYIIGLDHELVTDLRLGVSFIYKQHQDIFEGERKNNKETWVIPYAVNDPGYDGVYGTEDDAVLNMVDRQGPQQQMWYTNVDGLSRKYQAVEFVMEKRWSNNWQFQGALLLSKAYGTIGNQYNQSVGIWEGIADTPNYFINRDGRINTDQPVVLKLQGSYMFTGDWTISFYYIGHSGGAYARQLDVYMPSARTYINVNAEPQGTRRYPFFNNLNLRLAKGIRFGSSARVALYLELTNALNSTYFNVNSANHGRILADGSFLKNAQWLKVNSVNVARTLRVGVRFTF
ncbi:TonB-dependent receptor domain-containing protein [Acidobacteriota bacterium]